MIDKNNMRSFIRNMRGNSAGFTLTEILVVAVIVGILAGSAVPTYIGYIRHARLNTARSTCEIIAAAAIQAFQNGSQFNDCGATKFGGGNERWEQDLGLKRSPDDGLWLYSYGCPDEADLGVKFVISVSVDPAGPLKKSTWIQKKGTYGYYYPYRNPNERWDGFFKK